MIMYDMYIILIIFTIMLNIGYYEFFTRRKYLGTIQSAMKGLNKRDHKIWWKENKPKYKQHCKDCKNLRKELRNLVNKDFGPWANYTLEFLKIQIKYWIKYYSLGYNVVAMEYEDWKKQEIEKIGYLPDYFTKEYVPTRLEIAKQLQILIYRYEDFHFGLTDEELIEYEENPNNFPEGLFQNRKREFREKYYYIDENGEYRPSDKLNEDYEKCRRELMEYYYKYAGGMWD